MENRNYRHYFLHEIQLVLWHDIWGPTSCTTVYSNTGMTSYSKLYEYVYLFYNRDSKIIHNLFTDLFLNLFLDPYHRHMLYVICDLWHIFAFESTFQFTLYALDFIRWNSIDVCQNPFSSPSQFKKFTNFRLRIMQNTCNIIPLIFDIDLSYILHAIF